MTTRKISFLYTIIVISTLLFFATAPKIFADDNMVSNLYTNPTIQSLSQTNDQTQSIQSQNNQKRHLLQQLLRTQVVIGGIELIARFENSKFVPQLQLQVDQNTNQLANLMGQLYTSNQQNNFRILWDAQVGWLNQYADARRDNNSQLLDEANQQLQIIGDRLTDFFTQKDRDQWNTIRQSMQTYIDDEKALVDAHAEGRDGDLLNIFIQSVGESDALANQILQLTRK